MFVAHSFPFLLFLHHYALLVTLIAGLKNGLKQWNYGQWDAVWKLFNPYSTVWLLLSYSLFFFVHDLHSNTMSS